MMLRHPGEHMSRIRLTLTAGLVLMGLGAPSAGYGSTQKQYTPRQFESCQLALAQELRTSYCTARVEWLFYLDVSYSYLGANAKWRDYARRLEPILAALPVGWDDTVSVKLFADTVKGPYPVAIVAMESSTRSMSRGAGFQDRSVRLDWTAAAEFATMRRNTGPRLTDLGNLFTDIKAEGRVGDSKNGSKPQYRYIVVLTDGCQDRDRNSLEGASLDRLWNERLWGKIPNVAFILDKEIRPECGAGEPAQIFLARQANEGPRAIRVIRWRADEDWWRSALFGRASDWLFEQVSRKVLPSWSPLILIPDRMRGRWRLPIYWLEWGARQPPPSASFWGGLDVSKDGSQAQESWPQGGQPAPLLHIEAEAEAPREDRLHAPTGLRIRSGGVEIAQGDGIEDSLVLPGTVRLQAGSGQRVVFQKIGLKQASDLKEMWGWLCYRGRGWALVAVLFLLVGWYLAWIRLHSLRVRVVLCGEHEHSGDEKEAGEGTAPSHEEQEVNSHEKKQQEPPRDLPTFPTQMGSDGLRLVFDDSEKRLPATLAKRSHPPSLYFLYGQDSKPEQLEAERTAPGRQIVDFFPFLGSGYWIDWRGTQEIKLREVSGPKDMIVLVPSGPPAVPIRGILYRPSTPWLHRKDDQGPARRILPAPTDITIKNRADDSPEKRPRIYLEAEYTKAGFFKDLPWKLRLDKVMYVLAAAAALVSLSQFVQISLLLDIRLLLLIILLLMVGVAAYFVGMRVATGIADPCKDPDRRTRRLAYWLSWLPPMVLYSLLTAALFSQALADSGRRSPVASVAIVFASTFLLFCLLNVVKGTWVRRRVEKMKGFGVSDILLELFTGAFPWIP